MRPGRPACVAGVGNPLALAHGIPCANNDPIQMGHKTDIPTRVLHPQENTKTRGAARGQHCAISRGYNRCANRRGNVYAVVKFAPPGYRVNPKAAGGRYYPAYWVDPQAAYVICRSRLFVYRQLAVIKG